MKKFKIIHIIIAGAILTGVGVAGAAPTLYYQELNARALMAAQNAPKQPSAPQPAPVRPVISGHPSHLTIPSLSMQLSVIDGYYNEKNGTWSLTNDKVQYATPTALPNDTAGNTFIYGHYRPEVFARLHKIQPGSEVAITTSNGYRFIYKYRDNYTIPPTDTSVLHYEGPAMLTLQTCTGTWFQDRQLFRFDFVRVEKI